jgi:imidazolonepropionase-like amidohydrolase
MKYVNSRWLIALLLLGTRTMAEPQLSLLGPAAPPLGRGWIVVHAGSLLAMPGTAPTRNQTVIIEDGRIKEIRGGFAMPAEIPGAAGAVVADLSHEFVMPGLIDAHVHLENALPTSGNPLEQTLAGFTNTEADIAFAAAENARTVLNNGFTTVRGAGDLTDTVGFALKRAIKAGRVVAPRLLQAGKPVGPTGTQGDPRGYRPEFMGVMTASFADRICEGVDACRQAVRHRVNLGSDVIKVKASGGVQVLLPGYPDAEFTDDELRAIVQTAHQLGRKVMAHAISNRSTKAALRAGVDSIEHGNVLDDEAIRLFKEKGAWLVPTLSAPHDWAEQSASRGVPEDQAKQIYVGTLESFRKAHAAGVKIAFGTDVGYSPHSREPLEFLWMVRGGMSPAEAIWSATIGSAELLGVSADVGTIQPGKVADLVATSGDPLGDINQMTKIDFVMQGGIIRKSVAVGAIGNEK